jgi:hypothetical protein
MEYYFIECECHCSEHIVRIVYDSEEDNTGDAWDDIYMDVQLNPRLNIFRRLVVAFKYIFKLGYSNNMPWESTIINRKQLPEIIELLNRLKKD